ncbi:hypothetical protein [Haloarchaeobius sp. FL176]|uniref:hypothetical protein n=1 Tax=Haloarchaeobius sp. FL176 TaxID=2967129 RepID=UPI002149353C|nr:hypothetical protein [Haloarchaeobius sp. FL176]
MNNDISRRATLRVVSGAIVASAGAGVASASSGSSESTGHEIENDLLVKDLTESGGEIQVRFLNNEGNIEFSRIYNTRSQTFQNELNVDISGDGRYIIQVQTPDGVTTKPMDILPGGVTPSSVIMVTRYPDKVQITRTVK